MFIWFSQRQFSLVKMSLRDMENDDPLEFQPIMQSKPSFIIAKAASVICKVERSTYVRV